MLTDLCLTHARDGLRRKDFTAAELTDAYLEVMEALNPRLNAYITVMADTARAAAADADKALAAGDQRPLLGLPLAIKDLFCTAGTRTTAGSRILSPFVPPYESTVTANLLRDGAVFLGKANMDEFAMGSSNMTSAYGPVQRDEPGAAGAGRVLRRISRRRRGASRAGRNRDGHRRQHPAARVVLRHRRGEADLWPLLPMGHCRLRVVARPGRADGADRGGLRGAAG